MSSFVSWSQVSVTIVMSILRSLIAFLSRSSLCFIDLMLTVAILSCFSCSFIGLWVWICFRFLTSMPCCLLWLFQLVLFHCCILFCILSSLILLIVPNGNPDRLPGFASFFSSISHALLYLISMISIMVIIKNTCNIVKRMGIQVLNICTELLQYYYTISGSQEKIQ